MNISFVSLLIEFFFGLFFIKKTHIIIKLNEHTHYIVKIHDNSFLLFWLHMEKESRQKNDNNKMERSIRAMKNNIQQTDKYTHTHIQTKKKKENENILQYKNLL